MKTYRLLQDYRTPGTFVKAGHVFTENQMGYFHESQVGKPGILFTEQEFLKYPDWFEEVKEPQESFLQAYIARNSTLTVYIPSEYTGVWDFSIPKRPTLTLTRKY